jgi:hypothetical protein
VISGLWLGALAASLSIWTIIWLNKKNKSFKYDKIIIALVYYLLIIVPLYYFDIIGHPFNKLWGIDKLLLGIISGSIVFLASIRFGDFLKNKNQGKVYFPYQKVAIPLLFLLIASVIFYFVVKCY